MVNRIIIIICAFWPLVALGQKDVRTIKVHGVSFQMVKVEGGIFDMGDYLPESAARYNDKLPPHEERVSTFFIGQTEVTQQLWKAVMGRTPKATDAASVGDLLPVTDLNYDECIEFINRLNQLTKLHFRLPTEAEWEFAARGGIKSKGYIFAGSNNPDDVAWWGWGHAGGRYHAVATKLPNELGLYDMCGNVSERCGDESFRWELNQNMPLTTDFRIDSAEAFIVKGHALRGGSIQNGEATGCTVTSRFLYDLRPAGLRLVLDTSDSDKGIYTIKNEDGVKLDYIKMTESTVALTYNELRYAKISGTLHIPATVTIKGKQYKVTAIGDKALSGNPNLEAVYVPATVTHIGEQALTRCDNLKQIVVDTRNRVLDSRENCNAIIDTDHRMLIRGCAASIIPEGIRHIGPYAFFQCQSLTGIRLPNSLLSIREYAFTGCRQLSSIVLPSNLILIEDYAFAHTPLKSINIPDQLIHIREGAFFETQIDEITIPTPKEEKIRTYYLGDFAFYRMEYQTKVNTPSIELGQYYAKGKIVSYPPQASKTSKKTLKNLTEQDPIGLYHLTKVTYDEGSKQIVPDFEQYKYCARAITLTTQPERADDGTLTIPFLDNDRMTLYRHTGNVAVGTNGRGIRVYDSDSARFTLKWYNSDRTESETFPRNQFINEHYDANEGVASDMRTAIDILKAISRSKTLSISPTTGEAGSGSCWQRIGIVRMRHGVIEKFFPMLGIPKYKLFYQQQVIDLYDSNIPSDSYTEEVAPRFTIRMKPSRYQPDRDTFLLTYATEDDGTEYAELYELSSLPKRITNIFN